VLCVMPAADDGGGGGHLPAACCDNDDGRANPVLFAHLLLLGLRLTRGTPGSAEEVGGAVFGLNITSQRQSVAYCVVMGAKDDNSTNVMTPRDTWFCRKNEGGASKPLQRLIIGCILSSSGTA
jgi:hypothetical protein